jgi:integrase/recombinase XerD
MATHNPKNERIKRQYFAFLKEAKRQGEDSVDAAAKALARFEIDTKGKDFKAFHFQQAIAFKKHLAEQNSLVTGSKLSKATLNATLAHLKRFFQWLAGQPGYRSQFQYTDAEYFNLSDKDTRVANARRERPAPTLEQIEHVIAAMPARTEIERRNRALIAFALLTGARDSALASMKLKHVDLVTGSVYQDAREVKTKFSKSFTTYFFPVSLGAREIAGAWINDLREGLWGHDDPLFPATQMELNDVHQFEAMGLARKHWSTASPIRAIFRQAFESAGLPYFNPHSFRHTLVQLGERLCQTPEDFKAWSQNLGHEGVLTTFYSYGSVTPRRQGEIIHALAKPSAASGTSPEAFAQAVARAMRGMDLSAAQGETRRG